MRENQSLDMTPWNSASFRITPKSLACDPQFACTPQGPLPEHFVRSPKKARSVPLGSQRQLAATGLYDIVRHLAPRDTTSATEHAEP